MKFEDYEIPDDLVYSEEHEWVISKGDKLRVGITDYAVKALHDVVFVNLPQVGQEVQQGGNLGSVESIKAVSDVFSPISGKVESVNDKLISSPEIVNQSPYSDGWLADISPSQWPGERAKLLDAQGYADYLKRITSGD
ncbi:MAG: glycine cleavage system protein GcvH [Nitrososphaerales archaeon]